MQEISNLGKMLVFAGLLLIILGLVFIFAGKINWIGRLPGDIYIQRKNFSFYFPLTTSILISILLTFILWLLKRR